MKRCAKQMSPLGGGVNVPLASNAEIDFMKLIASITIVFHHSIYATNTESSRIWTGGYMSVAFFFCISGYLMSRSAFRAGPCSQSELGRETVKFMLRKIKNILPWYLFAWISSYIILCAYYGFDLRTQAKMLGESLFPTLLVYMAGFDGFEVVGAVWYLSAMYLCMPVIYVFLRTKKDLFVWVAAPLLTLFLYGYIHKAYGGFGIGTIWIGFCYGGVIFAAAGLLCGCFCFGVSEWLRRQRLTKFSCILISFLDMGTFIVCLILMQIRPDGAINATMAFLFAVVVTASFSGKSYTTNFFNRFCNSALIRKFSIAVYLCHGRVALILTKYFPDIESYEVRLSLYLVASFLLSVLCVVIVELVRSCCRERGRMAFYYLFFEKEKR